MCACMAETVSQKQAQQLAHLFFNEAAGRVTAPPKLIYNGRRLTTNRLFNPFYIYNTPLGGFVIISAENKAMPILGFSLKDNFDPEKISEAETALFKSYAREIELVRYDSQPVEDAVSAWTHYPEYIHEILSAKYIATDPKLTTEEALGIIERDLERDDAVEADLYTPAQWRSMIDEELALKESVPVAIISDNNLSGAVIYGRQGEYYRIELTGRNNWLLRLNATEVIPSAMLTVVATPIALPFVEDEEKPFESHEDFLAEVVEKEESRREVSSIDLITLGEEPLVKANGGGHYEIVLPERVVESRIYNLSGSLVRKYGYGDTNVANVDLSAEPFGCYIVLVKGESGTPYGFKLYR